MPAVLLPEHIAEASSHSMKRLLREREALRSSDCVSRSEQVTEYVERRLAIAITQTSLLLRREDKVGNAATHDVGEDELEAERGHLAATAHSD